MDIKVVKQSDISQIISIHQEAFPDFFLTSLGDNFLYLYYSSICKSLEAVFLCVKDEKDTIIGFAASSLNSNGFNSRLIKRDLFSYLLLSVKLAFSSPKSLIRLIKNLSKTSDKIKDDGNYAELFSIGVRHNFQGKGVGGNLLKQTEEMIQASISTTHRLSLTTDYYNNDSALCFYKSKGYEVLYDFISFPNRRMYRLIKQL